MMESKFRVYIVCTKFEIVDTSFEMVDTSFGMVALLPGYGYKFHKIWESIKLCIKFVYKFSQWDVYDFVFIFLPEILMHR